MKLSKKIITLALAAVMTIGMSSTAFAANESMDAGSSDYTFNYDDVNIYGGVKIIAGKGSIADITDTAIQDKVVARIEAVIKDLNTNFLDAQGLSAVSLATFAFDVQDIESGEVTVALDMDQETIDELNAWKEYYQTDIYAYVSHLNAAGEWETCFSKVTDDYKLTFKFDSYSPVVIVLTDGTQKTDGTQLADIALAYNDNPVQQVAKSPKTADNMMFVIVLAAGCALALGTKKVVTR